METTTYDIGIIGDGVIANSIAFELLQSNPELKIVRFTGGREYAASTAAGAMLNVVAEVEPDTLKSDIGRYKFELALKATTMWKDFTTRLAHGLGFGDYPYPVGKGTYVIANDFTQKSSYIAIVDAANQYDIPFVPEFDNNHNVKIKNEPVQPKQEIKKALFLKEEGWTSPLLLLHDLDRYLVKKDVIFVPTALATEVAPNGEFIVLTKVGNVRVVKLIVAAGANSQRIVEEIGTEPVVPMFYGVGTSMIVQTELVPEYVIRTTNRALSCGIHVVPVDDNHVFIGASSQVRATPDKYVELDVHKNLIEGVCNEIDNRYIHSKLVRRSTGFRPVTLDGFPVIGETSIDNLFIASGTRRDGIHCAPLVAKDMVTRILGNEENLIKGLEPHRKPYQTMTVEEAKTKAITYRMTEAAQHNKSVDVVPIINEVNELYEKVGLDYGIQPEIVKAYLDRKEYERSKETSR